MISVTKQFEFCYAHHLKEYHGKCARIHGHNAVLEVSFAGPLDEEYSYSYPGMVIDFSMITDYITPILDSLDHQLLNNVGINWSYGTNPTCENILLWIVEEIQNTRIGDLLVEARLSETPKCWATWRKED